MKVNLIKTELSLVYRKKNSFTAEEGLNLRRVNELWGIRLLSGTVLALTYGEGNNVASTMWEDVRIFAKRMKLDGKSGSLPSKDILCQYRSDEEKAKFDATVRLLAQHGIVADGYGGVIWCLEEYDSTMACCFRLTDGGFAWGCKTYSDILDRIAVAF